jgi:hypothetical protein
MVKSFKDHLTEFASAPKGGEEPDGSKLHHYPHAHELINGYMQANGSEGDFGHTHIPKSRRKSLAAADAHLAIHHPGEKARHLGVASAEHAGGYDDPEDPIEKHLGRKHNLALGHIINRIYGESGP